VSTFSVGRFVPQVPSVKRHEALCIVLKRAYYTMVIDGEFCLRTSAVNKPEPRFDRHAYTPFTRWNKQKQKWSEHIQYTCATCSSFLRVCSSLLHRVNGVLSGVRKWTVITLLFP